THIHKDRLLVFGDEHFIHRRVQDFIKKQTALYIDEKAQELATRLGVKINKITMKDTTSRWGSCSGKNNLNFCWRLGLAPLYVLDYIIAHEVAHLREMNHGPQFWKIVSEIDDNRASAEIWLRRNGHTLR
ncbi:MAG: M48 family metallopeptidase, partial [Alphaproteobacteria bacterium]|nr:M48 family metallopeptidase [Alphaproteobacteria bacterium]